MTYRQCAFICLLGIYEAAKFVVPTWNFQPLPNLGARKEFAGEPQAKAFRSSFKYSRRFAILRNARSARSSAYKSFRDLFI